MTERDPEAEYLRKIAELQRERCALVLSFRDFYESTPYPGRLRWIARRRYRAEFERRMDEIEANHRYEETVARVLDAYRWFQENAR